MNQITISQYFLLNSNEGFIKIIEFNNIQNLIFLWGLSKEFNFCEECSDYKWFMKCPKLDNCPKAMKKAEKTNSPEYVRTGDSNYIQGYFSSINQFSELLNKTYPNHRIIPIGMFRNIIECRTYLSEMKATLNGKAI